MEKQKARHHLLAMFDYVWDNAMREQERRGAREKDVIWLVRGGDLNGERMKEGPRGPRSRHNAWPRSAHGVKRVKGTSWRLQCPHPLIYLLHPRQMREYQKKKKEIPYLSRISESLLLIPFSSLLKGARLFCSHL